MYTNDTPIAMRVMRRRALSRVMGGVGFKDDKEVISGRGEVG